MRRRAGREEQIERLAWSLTTFDEVRGSGALVGSNVAIGSYDHYVYCVDPERGELLWKFPTGRGVVARPARVQELVVVGSEDRMLYGITAADGALRWTCRTGMAIRSSAAVAGDRVIVTMGERIGDQGGTNTLRLVQIGAGGAAENPFEIAHG